MALPTWVANSSPSSSGTFVDVSYYSGLQANDIAWILIAAVGTGTLDVPSGWTALAAVTIAGSGSMRCYWKRLVGSESGTETINGTGVSYVRGVMCGIRGALDTGTPYEDLDNTKSSVNGTAQAANTVDLTVADTLGLRLSFASTTTVAATSSAPAGWTSRLEDEVSANASMWIDTVDKAVAGTTVASTRTLSTSGFWGTQTLAMLPLVTGQPTAKRMGGVAGAQQVRRGRGISMWREQLLWV